MFLESAEATGVLRHKIDKFHLFLVLQVHIHSLQSRNAVLVTIMICADMAGSSSLSSWRPFSYPILDVGLLPLLSFLSILCPTHTVPALSSDVVLPALRWSITTCNQLCPVPLVHSCNVPRPRSPFLRYDWIESRNLICTKIRQSLEISFVQMRGKSMT